MTAKKNLKRLVRARAKKTGESYAAALRNFLKKPPGGDPMTRTPAPTVSASTAPLHHIEKPQYGFTLQLPADWREDAPDPFNSPWEVARFSAAGSHVRNCLVFRNPERPNAALETIVRDTEAHLTRTGFGHFRHLPMQLAGQPAARMDFERTTPDGGTWSVRHHFVLAAGHRFCLSFGTTGIDEDAGLLDVLASRFELIGDPPGAAAPPPDGDAGTDQAPRPIFAIDPALRQRITTYSTRARSVLIAAHEEALRRGAPAVDQAHLLAGIANVDGSMGLLILSDLGVSQTTLLQAAASLLPPIPSDSRDPAPPAATTDEPILIRLTEPLQATLTLAEEEARTFGHHYVGVEHLLLGLLRETSGHTYELLTRHGVTAEAARTAFLGRSSSNQPESSKGTSK